MRCVPHHHGTFVERLIDQVNLPAGQVAYAAMHQFCGPARGRLREVASLHQSRAKAARHRIHRDAQSSGAAPNDQYIERLP